MANKEHSQFSEIKKLRVQVAELSKAVDAERVDASNRVEDARRRGEEEVARLLKDIDTMRQQFAQVQDLGARTGRAGMGTAFGMAAASRSASWAGAVAC